MLWRCLAVRYIPRERLMSYSNFQCKEIGPTCFKIVSHRVYLMQAKVRKDSLMKSSKLIFELHKLV